jgi:anti-sigma B factor antagonist
VWRQERREGKAVSRELVSQVTGTSARVELHGDVDMATAPELRRVLEELIDGGAEEIVLDCHHLEFLDSSGIGALVAARSRIGAEGVIALEAPRANVRKVLEVTGVDRELSIRP